MTDGVNLHQYFPYFEWGLDVDITQAPRGQVNIGTPFTDDAGTLSARFIRVGAGPFSVTIEPLDPRTQPGDVIGTRGYPWALSVYGDSHQGNNNTSGPLVYAGAQYFPLFGEVEENSVISFDTYQHNLQFEEKTSYQVRWSGQPLHPVAPATQATMLKVKLADGWEQMNQPHTTRGTGMRIWDGTQWLHEVTGEEVLSNVRPMNVWTGTKWELGCLFGEVGGVIVS